MYALIDFCHDIFIFFIYIFSLLGWPPSLPLSILRTVNEQLRKETADSSAGGAGMVCVFYILLYIYKMRQSSL